jgi:hypothetical protein
MEDSHYSHYISTFKTRQDIIVSCVLWVFDNTEECVCVCLDVCVCAFVLMCVSVHVCICICT